MSYDKDHESKHTAVRVGTIGNYYGGVMVNCINGRYYWAVGNYDFEIGESWVTKNGKIDGQEITKEFYDQLILLDTEER